MTPAAEPSPSVVRLSPRELEIARLMAEGLSYSEIAARIGWTPDSVRVAAKRLGARLPGDGSPVVRILRWWFSARLLTKGN